MITAFFNISRSKRASLSSFLNAFNSSSSAEGTLFFEKSTDLTAYSRLQRLIIPSLMLYSMLSSLTFLPVSNKTLLALS